MQQGKDLKELNSSTVDGDWLDTLFYISESRCDITETCQVYKDKCLSQKNQSQDKMNHSISRRFDLN